MQDASYGQACRGRKGKQLRRLTSKLPEAEAEPALVSSLEPALEPEPEPKPELASAAASDDRPRTGNWTNDSTMSHQPCSRDIPGICKHRTISTVLPTAHDPQRTAESELFVEGASSRK
jgi:hypothetical protein